MKTRNDQQRDLTDVLLINLSCPHTTLSTLEDLVWKLESNQGGTFLRHSTGLVHAIPFWITQMVENERDRTESAVKLEIRTALGFQA